MADPEVVLITGASSGIGRAAAALLARNGYRVYGTSRDPSRAEPAAGTEMLPLDVRSDDSAQACVEEVLRRAGHLDILVNNAGYELAGAIEDATLEEARAQFETNFFGALRMLQAALPPMRLRRRGKIVTIGSVAGITPMPFLGLYSATKFALEGASEALRHELKPLGIHVSIVEATILKTQLDRHRAYGSRPIPDYEPWRTRALHAVRRREEKAEGPDCVARALLRIARSPRPRLRYRAGKHAGLFTGSRRLLPGPLFEGATRAYFRLDSRR